MNSINNVNGAGANQPMRPGETNPVDLTAQTKRQDDTAVAGSIQPGRDTYQRTNNNNISDLVAQVERVPETPRQDKVAQAQQRMTQGFYNQRDVLENVALQLINTGN